MNPAKREAAIACLLRDLQNRRAGGLRAGNKTKTNHKKEEET
jgi:hypothetical protein